MEQFKLLRPVLAMIVSMAVQSAQGACRNDILPSTPSEDFTLRTDGTVAHNPTGLVWMRCSLGQNWDGVTCSGLVSTYSWPEALQAANSYSYAGYSDWRLPSKNELQSIVEDRCWGPAINTIIFPNTPSDWFWSSSPSAASLNNVWSVHFFYGGHFNDYGPESDDNKIVRLVRAGP